MKLNTLVLALAVSSSVTAKAVDVSKGTDIIPPDSKEAAALHHSDKAVKTSPKDNTNTEDLIEGGDKYTKSEPKIDHQKIDVPDTDRLGDEVTVKDEDHPVVLNDYDPNNIGIPGDKEGSDSGTGATSGSSSSTNANANNNNGNSKAKDTENKKDDSAKQKSSSSTSSTTSSTSSTSKHNSKNTKHNKEAGTSPFHSFSMAASMILFSEVGDKTFLIAALMAMKHPRVTVFTAALSSLVVMSVLSAFLGHTLPALLPKKLTSLLAAVLFVIFGVKLAREGLEMKPGVGVEDELEEVEHEIEEKEMAHRDSDLEGGFGGGPSGLSEKDSTSASASLKRASSSPRLSQDGLDNGSLADGSLKSRGIGAGGSGSGSGEAQATWRQFVEGVSNLAALVLSPIWVQVFVMTFLGEWGDRSQVATIAMAAGSDYWFVILGAIAGHAVCTGTAVIGGRLLATKISMRHVTLAGSLAFLVFAVIYFVDGMTMSWSGE